MSGVDWPSLPSLRGFSLGGGAREPAAPRVGLVLGAGGITGIAWLAGAVRAVEAHTGWAASSADIIAGTSAGAIVAAVLAGDHDPCELLIYGEQPETLRAAITHAKRGRVPEPRTLPLPVSLRLGISGLLNPDMRRLSGFLPTGVISNDEIRGLTHAAASAGWPTHCELWLNACDARSGRLVSFGRPGAPKAPLADAVVASCAVPSYYRPVTIGGRRYIDGGVRSLTNADLLVEEACDIVIVMSPFSSIQRGSLLDTALFGVPRRATAMQTAREVARLREAGSKVLCLQPTGVDIKAMGLNPMDRAHSRHVMDTATESVAALLPEALGDVELVARPARTLAAAA
jgi:NTE family protein